MFFFNVTPRPLPAPSTLSSTVPSDQTEATVAAYIRCHKRLNNKLSCVVLSDRSMLTKNRKHYNRLGVSYLNDAGLRTGFPLGNQPISEVGIRGSRWFWHATAMPFHDQQARSAGFNRGSGAIKCSKRGCCKFDGRTELCHTVMTLRKVFCQTGNQRGWFINSPCANWPERHAQSPAC